MRKKIVAGNWKMNNTLEEGKKLALEVLEKATGNEKAKIVLGTPLTLLTPAKVNCSNRLTPELTCLLAMSATA